MLRMTGDMVTWLHGYMVRAQGIEPEEGRHLVDEVPTLQYFEVIFSRILTFVTTAGGLAVLVMLIVGGFQYFTSSGEPQQTAAARQTLTWAIGGLAILIGAWFVLLFIEQFTGVEVTIFKIPID